MTRYASSILCAGHGDKMMKLTNRKALTTPDGPTEIDLGKSMIDAAATAGVQHLVFSSGPNCTELTNGKVQMKAMNSEYYHEN